MASSFPDDLWLWLSLLDSSSAAAFCELSLRGSFVGDVAVELILSISSSATYFSQHGKAISFS